MTRIFIEDQELDITKDFSQQITYAVDDLQNTDSKATSFSKTIVIPGTANNNKLLGNIFEFSNSNFTGAFGANVGYNFNASKSAKARLEINGLQVMKGVMRLLEVIVDGEWIEYEVALFGELGGFYSSMGARKLTNLDFSEYNHQYNVTNITASWDNASGGTGYYYPLIDYGTTSPPNMDDMAKKNFYFTAFRPAFFVKQYMEKIIEQAGYTYSSDFFNTSFFKRLIIPNNQNKLSFNKINIFQGKISKSMGSVGSSFDSPALINLTNVASDDFEQVLPDPVYRYTKVPRLEGAFSLFVNGTARVYSNNPADDGFFSIFFVQFALIKKPTVAPEEIWKSDVLAFDTSGYVPIGTNPRSVPYFISRPFNIPAVFDTNDEFALAVYLVDIFGEPGAGTFLELSVNETTSSIGFGVTNQRLTSASYNDFLYVNGTLPANILQKDFFTSVLKTFNLMVTEDKYKEKHLNIEPYVDFYDTDRTTYLDWSDKIDRSKPIKIKPMSEINARYYQFKYKSDSDYLNDEYKKKYNEGYGDRVFDNELDFAKETDSTDVIFSASPLIGYSGNDKVFPAIYKLNNGVEQMIEHNVRIMQAKKITGRTGWFIKNRVNNENTNLSTSLTSYGYAGHFNDWTNPTSDLNFGAPKEVFFNMTTDVPSANLFNTYYSPYFAEITDKDSRLVTCRMKLNEKDIFNLDFGRFIWVDGVLYRLIKIVDYAPDDTCEVQLLRAINTTY